MKENNRILLVGDNNHDIDDVVSNLESKGITLELPANLEIGRQFFKQNQPHVLLLSFGTLKLAQAYYLSLLKDAQMDEGVLHQTIFLCTAKDALEAAELAQKRLIDDYFIFKPVHDPNRLSLCIQHALDRRTAQIKLGSLIKESDENPINPDAIEESDENPINLDAIENFTNETLNKHEKLQEDLAQSREKLIEGIEGKLSQFEQSMSQPELRDAVQVIDKTLLSQHFHRLKQEELKKDFDTFEADTNHSHNQLLSELKVYIHEFKQENEPETISKASIFIIDDDPKSIKLLHAMLQPEGYRVKYASGIKQAIILAVREPPDLILMDVMMPEVNGIELTRRFKKHSRLMKIPIVMITAHPSTDVVQLSTKVGASDLLTKPIRRSALLEKIEAVLDKEKSNE